MRSFEVGDFTVEWIAGSVHVRITATGDIVAQAQGAQAIELVEKWKQYVDSLPPEE